MKKQIALTMQAASLCAVTCAQEAGRGAMPQGWRRPTPTSILHPPEPATGNGHKLDLYIPAGAARPLPVVIWTGGSAWMADTGKNTAGGIASRLNPAGYAVAGVSIRSSSQVQFPGPAARYQGVHPLAAGQRGQIQPRSRSHRHHGRQLRRLDCCDGGGDRGCAGDGRLGRNHRLLE